MRIDELFQNPQPTLSFEFFPPRNQEGETQLFTAIEELRPLKPSFISVTRTGGGAPPTIDLTARIQNDLGFRAMSHLTCAGYTQEQIGELLDKAWNDGVRNILALRGDAAPGEQTFSVTEGGFSAATDLVKFTAARHDFCIGVAGYPEGHPQALNLERDAKYFKMKIDNGAHFGVTQLFFDNADFYRWRDRVQGLGVDVPLVAGIMPILNVAQIKRFVGMCGARIPEPLLVQLESLESDPASVHAAGVEYAIRQCEDLLANGVSGIHFYTLNRSKATVLISQALGMKHPA
ncbi:MAG: methylenetetrahydrofolate reductase [NAD(P)H] [Armatimonadetes bacterium]|nr:methylenetetrahydrofolate reductase [NAD(P)H] [Armatimonadota bacterium]